MALAELIVKLGVRGQAEVRGALDRTKRSLQEVGAVAKSTQSSIGMMMGAMAGLGAAAATIGIASRAIKVGLDFDSQVRGLAAYTGNAEELAAQLARLQELAKLPGLGLTEVRQGVLSLEAAGLSAEMAEKAIRGFGNALALAGRGKSDLEGVIVQLGQIASKGQVSAEEINNIAERVPQIRQVLVEAFGTASTEAIQKMGITADEAITRIIAGLDRLPTATGGAQTSFENLADAIDQALLPVGRGILDIFQSLAGPGETAVQAIARIGAEIGNVLTAIGQSGVARDALQSLFGVFTTGPGGFASAFATTASGILAFFDQLPAVVANGMQLAEQYILRPLANINATIQNMVEAIPFIGHNNKIAAANARKYADELNAKQYGPLKSIDVGGKAAEFRNRIMGSYQPTQALPSDLIYGGAPKTTPTAPTEKISTALEEIAVNTRETADNTSIESKRIGGGPLFNLGVTAREQRVGVAGAMMGMGSSSVMGGNQIERQIRRVIMDEMRRTGGYGIPRG